MITTEKHYTERSAVTHVFLQRELAIKRLINRGTLLAEREI